MATKDGKKRKRHSDNASPSKRVALQEALPDAKVELIHAHDDALLPIIVSSPGLTAPSVAFKGFAKPLSARSRDEIRPGTHDLLLQSSEHPRLDFTATQTSREQNLTHYIAVLDPTTLKLQVRPAHHLDLRTNLRLPPEEAQQERRSNAQQREALGLEFGTKKAKKAIASKTANAISKDTKGKNVVSDVQAAVLESLEQDGTDDKAVAPESEQDAIEQALRSKPIPFPDLSAETVEGVYPLSTLLPARDARLVTSKDWQEKLQNKEEIQTAHRFPAAWLSINGSTKANGNYLQALRYMALLLQFHDSLSGGGRGPRKVPKKEFLAKRLPDWPPALVDNVRRRFANDSGNELGKFQVDNLITHICALALFVDDWVTDATQLKDDLKLETSQMAQYFKELGCKVAKPTETESKARRLNKSQALATRIARLRLPLEFPKVRVRAPARR